MISLNEFKATRKYVHGDEEGSFVGTYFYGYYKEWSIVENFNVTTEELYYTINEVEAEFEELSDAEEVLYNKFLQENKLTEDYL